MGHRHVLTQVTYWLLQILDYNPILPHFLYPVHFLENPNYFEGPAATITDHSQDDRVLLRPSPQPSLLAGNQSVVLASEGSQRGSFGVRGLAQPDCQGLASPRHSGHVPYKTPQCDLAV